MNKDFLLEKEKGVFYWAFDTKELLKGDMQSRFAAYKTALDANFMQIDEVRFAEDMEPLGLNWVKLGLQDVLYDPVTKTIYTPNTNQTSKMGEEALPGGNNQDIIEPRAQPRDKDGRFASTGGSGGGKTKYAPSPQRSKKGIQLKSKKQFAKLCGTLNTQHPGLKKGERRTIRDAKYWYSVTADGNGGMTIQGRKKI